MDKIEMECPNCGKFDPSINIPLKTVERQLICPFCFVGYVDIVEESEPNPPPELNDRYIGKKKYP